MTPWGKKKETDHSRHKRRRRNRGERKRRNRENPAWNTRKRRKILNTDRGKLRMPEAENANNHAQ